MGQESSERLVESLGACSLTGPSSDLEELTLHFPWGSVNLANPGTQSSRTLGYLTWFRGLEPEQQLRYLSRLTGETNHLTRRMYKGLA